MIKLVTTDKQAYLKEAETDQASKMPASYLHPEFEIVLAKDYLCTMLQQNDLSTKIWILDHNFIYWNRVKWMLDDAEMKKATKGVAFHYYEGTAEMMSLLHEVHPEVELHWTEGGPDLGLNYQNDWCKWGQVFTEALNNWCKSITGWNLVLDENGKPSLGPFSCAGLVTMDSNTKELSYSGQYRAFAHFSKYIKRGARKIHSEGAVNSIYNHSRINACRLHHVAFENPSGELVIILTNSLEKQEIQLQLKDKCLRIALPAESITTVIIND